MCKSRSVKDLKLGPATEWDRIRNGFGDLDYIDMYCVMEFLEFWMHTGRAIPPMWLPDILPPMDLVTHHVSSQPNLARILPPSPQRARIARELLEEALGL